MKIGTKRRLTYVNIALLFLFGGVEYAVILPTLWLYISGKYHAEEWFFGLVLSGFSLTALLASPVFGRWSDVTRKTKPLFLFANLWSIGGSLMYWMGVSKWFILGGRLIAGVGTAVSAPIVADITRTTEPNERTSKIAILFALRQFGLLLGPGCNLFLKELDFYIGPFPVNKYTSPGLFMAVLWSLLEIFNIFTYYELRDLKSQDAEGVITTHNINYQAVENSEASIESVNSPLLDSQGGTPSVGASEGRALSKTVVTRSPSAGSEYGSVKSRSSDSEFGSVHTHYGSVRTQTSMFSGVDKDVDEVTSWPVSDSHQTYTSSLDPSREVEKSGTTSSSHYQTCESSASGHSNFLQSSELIESAEKQISQHGSPILSNTDQTSVQDHSSTQVPEESNKNDKSGDKKLTLRFLYQEYLREEIVVILASVFMSMFSQLSLETIATPMSQEYLNWKEMENSIFYCLAGVEIILVFAIVHFLSKRLQDRTLIVLGLIVNAVALAWMVYIMSVIQVYSPDNYSSNLAYILIGVSLDIFGLPFIAVCSVSLYSKVTDEQSQGFSQGLRRSVSGVAFILGPLWAGALLKRLQLLFAINLGLIILVLFLSMLSFKRLNIDKFVKNEDKTSVTEDESKPLLNHSSSA